MGRGTCNYNCRGVVPVKEQLLDLFREGWDFEPAYAAVCGKDRSRVDEAWGYWRAWEAER